MKNILFFILFATILSCSKDEGAKLNLNTEAQAAYDAVWGKTFGDFATEESISFGNNIEFTDEKDGLNVVTFKVTKTESYTTNSSDLVSGKGVLFLGENGYTCKVYQKDGETVNYLVFCYLNSDKRFDKTIQP